LKQRVGPGPAVIATLFNPPVSSRTLKILILKPSSLGDVVQALPVLRLLKQHWPASEIFWWVDVNLAPLLEGDRDLAGVVRFERRRWASPVHWPEMWSSIHWMRRQAFDLVIDLQGLARSGAFAWLARGELLVGLDEPREGARGYYDIIVPRASFYTHAVDWYLSVLKELKVPVHSRFDWLPERPAIAAGIKSKWETGNARWIVLQPGARWENKRWAVEHFADLISRLTAAWPDFRLAILGGEADRERGAALARVNPESCLDLTGRISLPEMVEWIRQCELMISNDTGPMHVAAAMAKPLVAIFGPTEPRRTGPYGQLDNVLQTNLSCVPCMKSYCTFSKPLECLRAISPEAVFARADRILKTAALRTVPRG
jgi:lipopolysaccharide heptosyltransferase I